MSSWSPEGHAEEPVRSALLWDLDNVSPPRLHLASLARTLCCLVAPDEPLVAAGHRVTFRACREVLSDLGYEVLSGGRRNNGADRVLLREAQALAERGVRSFLVASNDHRFARIARFADLHVLSLTDEYISGRLRAVARSVSVLSLSERGWERRDATEMTLRSAGAHPAA